MRTPGPGFQQQEPAHHLMIAPDSDAVAGNFKLPEDPVASRRIPNLVGRGSEPAAHRRLGSRWGRFITTASSDCMSRSGILPGYAAVNTELNKAFQNRRPA